jgi:hypothetical protein
MRAAVLFAGGFVGVAAAAGPASDLTPAEYARSADNLKRIARAVQLYEEAHGRLPNDVYLPKSPDKRPLLSWRVLIVPYLEPKADFDRVRLDEPWDGQNNKKLIPKMPRVFAPVRGTPAPGMTYYRTFSGKGLLFGYDRGQGTKVKDVTDGPASTALVVEAAEPVVWTRPDELKLPPNGEAPKLGGVFGGVAHVALLDGSVIRLRPDPDPAELRKLIEPADGGKVNLDALRVP